MEKTKRIELETATAFRLTHSELRRLYVALALCENRYQRNPEYNEGVVVRKLASDIEKILIELQHLTTIHPNNHLLQRARGFFDLHHRLISNQI